MALLQTGCVLGISVVVFVLLSTQAVVVFKGTQIIGKGGWEGRTFSKNFKFIYS